MVAVEAAVIGRLPVVTALWLTGDHVASLCGRFSAFIAALSGTDTLRL